jgi:hypothetical protein
MSNFGKRISAVLKSADYHGASVGFTYKNKSKHQTSFGGFITILSRIGIAMYLIALATRVINRESYVNFKSLYKSKTYDNQSYPMTLENFDLAFGMIPSDGISHLNEKLNISRYINLEVSYLEHFYETNSEGIRMPQKV